MKVLQLATLVVTATLLVSSCEASAVGKRVKGRSLTESTEPGTAADVITVTNEAIVSDQKQNSSRIDESDSPNYDEFVEQAPKGYSAPKVGSYEEEEEEEEEIVAVPSSSASPSPSEAYDDDDDDGYDDDVLPSEAPSEAAEEEESLAEFEKAAKESKAPKEEYNEEEEGIPALYEETTQEDDEEDGSASEFEEAEKEGKSSKENYSAEDDVEAEEEDSEYAYYEEKEADKAPKERNAPKERGSPKEQRDEALGAASEEVGETLEVPISTTTTTTTTTTVVVTTVKEYADGRMEYDEQESVTYSTSGADAAGGENVSRTNQAGTVSAQASTTHVSAADGEEPAVAVNPKAIFAPKSKEDRRIRPYSMKPRHRRDSHDDLDHDMANRRRRLTLPAPTLSTVSK
jgi:hypothetical protein